MTQDRQSLATEFLDENGWKGARRRLLAGDASNRSYDRVEHPDGRRAVLMNAPIEKGEDPSIFVSITKILHAWDYSAPEILASDLKNGFLLIEDLGDDLFARVCQSSPSKEAELYKAAVELLVDLNTSIAPPRLPLYDQAVYEREAALVTEWYLPASDTGASANLSNEFGKLINDACGLIPNHSSVLVMRDFHAENLIWLPDRDGIQRVGLLDYQDALAGHPAYDLVSLLEDARRDTSPKLQREMIDHYIALTGVNAVDFSLAYDILGAQRNLKIIGIFSRLYLRDGKAAYLDLIPRVWNHLQRDLANPELTDLRLWVHQHLPEPTTYTLTEIRGRNAG